VANLPEVLAEVVGWSQVNNHVDDIKSAQRIMESERNLYSMRAK